MKRHRAVWVLIGIASAGMIRLAGGDAVTRQAEKPRIILDSSLLISESDIACSFFILDEIPPLKILAGEEGSGRTLLADGDVFYFGGGLLAGLKVGQVLSCLELGAKISLPGTKMTLGPLAFRRGRARIVRLEDGRGVAQVEKACGSIMLGQLLVPFVERDVLRGKDLGSDVRPQGGEVLTGRFVFLENEYVQIGSGQLALIDLGKDHGIQTGQQLTICRRMGDGPSLEAKGNVVVVDIGRASATVKILSVKDAVTMGDLVQIK